jgi:hypothetical protein
MPSLCTENTSSDDEDTHQVNNHNGLKPQQMYSPPYPQNITTSPIFVLTSNTMDKAKTMQRIKIGLDNNTYCYLKFFNYNEIERMIDDGIPLQETISRTQLIDLSHYQETDRQIYTIIYNPKEQTLVHL